MKTKKTKQADLERRRSYHFTIGLILSVSVVVVAFEWRSPIGVIELPERPEIIDEVLPPIKSTVQEPPKPKVQPVIIPVADEEDIEDVIDIVLDVDISDPTPDFTKMDEPEVEETDEIHIVVEEKPSFPGGEKAFYQYVASKMKYPKLAVRQGIDGRVFVQFVVNRDGSLTDIQVIKGIGGGCDEEAVRVLGSAPRWNPGKQRGKPVRVRMALPIIFQLQ
ncbi:energy transducer TonB [Tunicatimonas pelagia]|uniref:energy transducer TonB n=1 Tax=Tunicatimonas pelagia TaxID=931531 RepID=UPI002666C49C|nr:energy transducer TonB [Tunicatimonas pelagia]WKN44329.1 TonB family protein [Tunicatimonas pelagia]